MDDDSEFIETDMIFTQAHEALMLSELDKKLELTLAQDNGYISKA